MSKILLKLSLVSFCVITITCLAARVLGSQQPTNMAMNGFNEECADPVDVCWYGVMINQTPVTDARNKLRGHNYFLVSSTTKPSTQNIADNELPCGAYFIYEYATVNGLVVRCRDLLLGDWINHFGMPDGVGQFHDVLFYTGRTKMRLRIKGALTPGAPIVEFVLYVPRTLSEYEYAWRGFAPRWRYCQLNIFNPCT